MTDNDDYMSNNFVNSRHDSRPGLVPPRISKKYQKELKHQEHNKNQKQTFKSRNVLEIEKRNQGLKSAIGQDNKGYQLLQKMGYKPNTGIGRHENGRIEPVPIDLKPCRGGIGEEADKKRRLEEVQKVIKEKKIKREKQYKEILKSKIGEKETIDDLRKSQKACEQLDAKTGKATPIEKFYWPKEFFITQKKDSDDEDDESENDEDTNFTELSNTEQLQILTEYLRKTYFYCIWCAIEYNDEEDMKSNCPGTTSKDHDD